MNNFSGLWVEGCRSLFISDQVIGAGDDGSPLRALGKPDIKREAEAGLQISWHVCKRHVPMQVVCCLWELANLGRIPLPVST